MHGGQNQKEQDGVRPTRPACFPDPQYRSRYPKGAYKKLIDDLLSELEDCEKQPIRLVGIDNSRKGCEGVSSLSSIAQGSTGIDRLR
jgi:hypothetical protein